MNNSAVFLALGNSTLAAVPAIHYRAAFAGHVHRICYTKEFFPDAIAVELEPEALSAMMALLLRFMEKKPVYSKLPCMLGLTRGDRQTTMFSDPVENITFLNPQGPLHRQAVLEICPLSPTDSIVEAVRCAIELKIPIYAVDLESAYPASKKQIIIQDPWTAEKNLEAYVRFNEPFAASTFDAVVDPVREQVMAGCLKTVLKKHQRVVFTGGIGHWKRLKKMIVGPYVQPIPVRPSSPKDFTGFQPTVIHPLLAVSYMDVFPAIAETYERKRALSLTHCLMGHPQRCKKGGKDIQIGSEPLRIFRDLIGQTYEGHFKAAGSRLPLDQYAADLRNRAFFEQFLSNLCIMEQRIVPGMSMIMHAAQAMMSPEFCKNLAEKMMAFPWVEPEDSKNLPVLAPVVSGPGRPEKCVFFDSKGRRSRPYSVSIRGNGRLMSQEVEIPWHWKAEKDLWPKPDQSTDPRGWPPVDYLLSALSVRAKELLYDDRKNKQIIPFEGSMHEGIDIKATLRSQIRGEDNIYVRYQFSTTKKMKPLEALLEPTVYIFRPGTSTSSRWHMHSGSMYMHHREHMRNPKRMDLIAGEQGSHVVSGLSYVDPTPLPFHYTQEGIFGHIIRGMVIFIPACFNGRQEARFLENNDFDRSPLTRNGDFYGLLQTYRDRHRMQFNLADWPTTLLKMAIPYAEKCVTVIAPDGFHIKPEVFAEAACYKIRVSVVPLSLFPKTMLHSVSRHLFCNPADKEGTRYPEYIERLMGQKADANSHLVPQYLREYGMQDFIENRTC